MMLPDAQGAMPLSNNAKTALVLASIAVVFFFGIMLKYWLFG